MQLLTASFKCIRNEVFLPLIYFGARFLFSFSQSKVAVKPLSIITQEKQDSRLPIIFFLQHDRIQAVQVVLSR